VIKQIPHKMCLNSLNTRYFTLSGWVQEGMR
jgi:hypothetical protein